MQELAIKLTWGPDFGIDEEEWPIVARALRHDGEGRFEADRAWELIVRRHADGCVLVHGVSEPGEGGPVGELVPSGYDVAAAVYRVAKDLGFDASMADEVIAKLSRTWGWVRRWRRRSRT